jgi:FkbM family methyltransferase
MSFLLHFLRKTDLFLDVGANSGAYSILSGKVVGCEVVSIEPNPVSHDRLKRNLDLNGVKHAKVIASAVGAFEGKIQMTTSFDSMNHVVENAHRDSLDTKSTIEVEISTINKIFADKNLRCPILIKIDVEGYELKVLSGAIDLLKSSECLAIIIETNTLLAKFGSTKWDIEVFLQALGFVRYEYNPFTRKLTHREISESTNENSIFVKDFERVQARLLGSREFEWFGKTF